MRNDEQSEGNVSPPETQNRSSSPFFPSEGFQENHKILQDNRVETLMDIKIEVKEEAEDLYVSGDEPYREKEITPEISADGLERRNYENRHSSFSAYVEDSVEDSPEINSMGLYQKHGSPLADLLSDTSIHKGSFPGHSYPLAYHKGGEMFPFSEHGECFVKAEELIHSHSDHNLTETYSHSE
uniref:Uncharacterized protein n=1 Tax=Pyxicephalus adspersus TaxID=30357 RepID=A0AAV3A098_PYXAD|nr:TPA: hypothetical protein GDO54_004771 [Pyxicephalus adspersus]